MDKDKILKIVTGRTIVSQKQAADILGLSKAQISRLIKTGKLEYNPITKPAKPYLDSVLEYKTNPNMKRNQDINVNGNNNVIGNNNSINIKK